MSSEAPGDVSPQEFAEATPAERREMFKEAADMESGEGSSLIPDLSDASFTFPDGAKDGFKSLLKARGDGMAVEDIQDSLPESVGDGPALIIRGTTRWIGVDEIPPIAEIVVGVYRTIKQGQ